MEKSKALTVSELTSMTERVGEGDEGVTMQAMLGASISLLGRELYVALIKKAKEGDYTFLLVPKKLDETEGVSLGQLIEDIKKLFKKGGEEPQLDISQLTDILGGDAHPIDSVIAKLSMAYIYYDRETKEGKEEPEVKTEYAFEITVDGIDDVFPKNFKNFVNFKSFQIAVWNTSNKKILEAMNIVDPNEYLNNL